ncbi:hypothetical protein C6I21_07910 [Alkalicoccus urumqiensis]|uniref:Bacterial Ig-like domain-containing protein n=2 Tax=Alkalicoccus urumqiensis TaxID=1548213 RepID=A0A2P6MHP4_ALKUR|nr:hypothetical protein C6I21_07910 [Alkalicoccus urumqiensis]
MGIDGKSYVTVDGPNATVTAMVEQADSATITINPDEDLDVDALLEELDITAEELEAMLTEEVDVDEDGMVSATFTLPPGTHTATVEADGASNTSEPFTIEAEADLSEDIAAAELAISELVDLDDVTLRDRASIMAARALVDAILEVDEDAEIDGLDDLEALEAAIADLFEDAAIDDAYFVTTSSFNVEFDGGITGLDEEDFEVTVDIEGEDEFTLTSDEVEVTSNEEGTVYTFVHPDLDGTEGDVTVNFNDEDTVLEYDFTEDALQAAVDAVNAADNDEDLLAALQAPVLNLQNVNPDFIGAYLEEIDGSFTNTADRIQNAIDRANAEFEETVLENIETLNTTTSVEDFVEALQALGVNFFDEDDDDVDFDDVDIDYSELLQLYFDAIQEAQPESVEEVQAVLTAVQEGVVADAVADAVEAPSNDSITRAQGFIDFFLSDEDDIDELEEVLAGLEDVAAINDAIADADDDALVAALEDAEIEGLEIGDRDAEEFGDLFEDESFATLADVQSFLDEANEEFIDDALDTLNDIIEDGEVDDDEDLEAALTALGVDTDDAFDDGDVFANLFAGTTFSSIEDVRAARDEARLVNRVNTTTNLDSAFLELEDEDYFNLGTTGRSDVTRIFDELNDEDFTSEEDIRAALTEAITAYNERLDGVNNASSIVQTRDALREAVQGFDQLEGSTQLELAENFRDVVFTEDAIDDDDIDAEFDEDLGRYVFDNLTSVRNLLADDDVSGVDDGTLDTSLSFTSLADSEVINAEEVDSVDIAGEVESGSTVAVSIYEGQTDNSGDADITFTTTSNSDEEWSETVDLSGFADGDVFIEAIATNISGETDDENVTVEIDTALNDPSVTSSSATEIVADFAEDVANVNVGTETGVDVTNVSTASNVVTFTIDGADTDTDSFEFTAEDTNGNTGSYTAEFDGTDTWTITTP